MNEDCLEVPLYHSSVDSFKDVCNEDQMVDTYGKYDTIPVEICYYRPPPVNNITLSARALCRLLGASLKLTSSEFIFDREIDSINGKVIIVKVPDIVLDYIYKKSKF